MHLVNTGMWCQRLGLLIRDELKMKKSRFVFVWPIFLMGLIFIGSSIPMDGGPDNFTFLTNLDPALQNLLHIPFYGMLSFLWFRSFSLSGCRRFPAVIFAIAITVSYGCLDEFHQSFVRGRYGGLMDIYLDSIGAAIGAGVGFYSSS